VKDRKGERELARALAARLAASGALRERRWIKAFETVPRHHFVRQVFVDPAHTGTWELVDGTQAGQRERWLNLVYRDNALVTQLSEDGNFLSSSSQPSLMARMLEALGFTGGERVLEVGTGTGYNAALLCAGLGSALVTGIDIDTGLVAAARGRLRELGCTPALAVGDGTDGYTGGAPYDRIIATCSLPQVPAAWIEQSAPGAIILVNRGFRDSHRRRRGYIRQSLLQLPRRLARLPSSSAARRQSGGILAAFRRHRAADIG
jgi:protein-L-isoaspartate(D-aspartate) O-methyltransferase